MNKRYLICITLLFVVFVLLGIVHQIHAVAMMDMNLLLGIKEIRTDFLTAVMKFFSFVGSWRIQLGIVGVLGCFFIVKRHYAVALLIVGSIVASIPLNSFLKKLFTRERPSIRIVEAGGYSFPSGHAMNNMALFGFLIFLVLYSQMKRIWKQIIVTLCILLILAISFSRMYLGVHYPTDILAGWCGGGFIVLVFMYIWQKWKV